MSVLSKLLTENILTEEYFYAPLYRPPGFATLPSGLEWDYHEAPPRDYELMDRRPDLPRSQQPFGVIKTKRPLTPDELRTFELKSV